MSKKAIIYARVSTTRQINEGHGLDSQLQRCEKYARDKGYTVEKTFLDEGISGGLFERPAMRSLIAFLDKNVTTNYVIIFDDLSRFARDVKVHLKMRTELTSRGATLECLNHNFDDSPEGEFIEVILAGKAQLDRQQNRRQVCQKMKARLERGYWCFYQPLGLKYIKDKEHGKLLAPKEPEATILKEALEKYAHGVLKTQIEVADFLTKSRLKGDSKIHAEGAKRFLTQPLYAGYVEYEPWGVELVKGHHQGLISFSTYQKNQKRLNDNSHNYIRRTNNEVFPLRGFVICEHCNRAITASWTTGRAGRKYPYYRCLTKGCLGSIKKNQLEEDFCKVIGKIKPKKASIRLFEKVFNDAMQNQDKFKGVSEQAKKNEIKELEQNIQKNLDLAFSASSDFLREEYEKRALAIKKKLNLIQKSPSGREDTEKVGNTFEHARELLKNPLKTWQKGNLRDRQTVQNLVFRRKLTYNRKRAVGNTDFSLTYTILSQPKITKKYLVEMAGIEPASKDLDHKLLQS